MAFVRFATSTRSLANQAKHITYGPLRKSSLKLLSPEIQKNLPTAPGNVESGFATDAQWWGQNLTALQQRFERWAKRSIQVPKELPGRLTGTVHQPRVNAVRCAVRWVSTIAPHHRHHPPSQSRPRGGNSAAAGMRLRMYSGPQSLLRRDRHAGFDHFASDAFQTLSILAQVRIAHARR